MTDEATTQAVEAGVSYFDRHYDGEQPTSCFEHSILAAIAEYRKLTGTRPSAATTEQEVMPIAENVSAATHAPVAQDNAAGAELTPQELAEIERLWPGPWHVDVSEYDNRCRIVRDSNGEHIATFYCYDTQYTQRQHEHTTTTVDVPQRELLARLVAARAPALRSAAPAAPEGEQT